MITFRTYLSLLLLFWLPIQNAASIMNGSMCERASTAAADRLHDSTHCDGDQTQKIKKLAHACERCASCLSSSAVVSEFVASGFYVPISARIAFHPVAVLDFILTPPQRPPLSLA